MNEWEENRATTRFNAAPVGSNPEAYAKKAKIIAPFETRRCGEQ